MLGSDDADASISFLEPAFDVAAQDFSNAVSEKAPKISPDIMDPVFIHSEVRIPKKVEKLFKSVSEIKFIYSIVGGDYIEIVDSRENTSLLKILTSEFEKFPFADPPSTSLNFIFNREKYRARVKSDLNKKYKKSLESCTRFVEYNHFAILKEKYLFHQLEHGSNFVYIDDGPFLQAQIKSAVGILRRKERYTPKVKKFDSKPEYLKGFLMAVPGVSEGVALAILSEYTTFESIEHGLSNKEKFCSLKIFDSAGADYRALPERIYKKLFSIFLSESPEEKI